MNATGSSQLVCPLSPWFYRRFGLAFLAVAGMSLYFLYDGKIGYPKKNLAADLHDAFVAGQSGEPVSLDEAVQTDSQRVAIEAAREAGANGSSWPAFAATRKLPGKIPHRYTAEEIREQFVFAAILGVLSLGMVAWILFYRKRCYLVEEDSFSTPGGEEIRFDRVTAIDLQKWDRGLARISYEKEAGGPGQVRVDDFKYAGADVILKRILSRRSDIPVNGDPGWLIPASESEKTGEGNHGDDAESPGPEQRG